ncbi:hypothetical protein NM688_g9295 [Phlebia brevispora]|uniref:Uncharacterized protein n=1 Tax=Phlebia brevispora TaxID=194682 RepID=A0ACC1RHB3_9APHY|nr:hypothetical protein NM688_g9295 [Phlebia brevispora]
MTSILTLLPLNPIAASKVLGSEHPYLTATLIALGALTFGKFLAKALGVFLQTFILPGKDLRKYGAGKGAWAVVTGASEGIGREFALQLAKKGFNVLVMARNKDKLNALCAEIEQGAASGKKVQARALAMDFSKLESSQWDAFRAEVENLDVGVLINNVGRSHTYPQDFVDVPEEEINNILAININATLKVTRTVLPGMIKRKRGLILSSASFAGVTIISPMLAPYAASKAFLASFNASLAEEVKGKGIDVETLNTYFVVSNMSKIRRPTMSTPLPKPYVKAVLSKIGLPCGALWTGRPTLSSPYYSHAFLDWFMNFVGWKALFAYIAHITHIDIRRRALRKLEREAKKQ